MASLGSTTRRRLTAALVLLMFAAPLRCVWEDARHLRQYFQTLALRQEGRPAPLAPAGHDCNESGCICRGATLAPMVDGTSLCGHDCVRLLAALELSRSTAVFVPADPLPDRPVAGFFTGPPTSGRQLRALLASLLI